MLLTNILNTTLYTLNLWKYVLRMICISKKSFTLHTPEWVSSWTAPHTFASNTSEMIIFFTLIFTLFIQSRCCSDLISTAVYSVGDLIKKGVFNFSEDLIQFGTHFILLHSFTAKLYVIRRCLPLSNFTFYLHFSLSFSSFS